MSLRSINQHRTETATTTGIISSSSTTSPPISPVHSRSGSARNVFADRLTTGLIGPRLTPAELRDYARQELANLHLQESHGSLNVASAAMMAEETQLPEHPHPPHSNYYTTPHDHHHHQHAPAAGFRGRGEEEDDHYPGGGGGGEGGGGGMILQYYRDHNIHDHNRNNNNNNSNLPTNHHGPPYHYHDDDPMHDHHHEEDGGGRGAVMAGATTLVAAAEEEEDVGDLGPPPLQLYYDNNNAAAAVVAAMGGGLVPTATATDIDPAILYLILDEALQPKPASPHIAAATAAMISQQQQQQQQLQLQLKNNNNNNKGERTTSSSSPVQQASMSMSQAGLQSDPATATSNSQSHTPQPHQPQPPPQPQQQQQHVFYKRDVAEMAYEKIRRWLWSHPSLEERRLVMTIRMGPNDCTPLHLLCKLHNPPDDIVESMLEAAPEVASYVDSYGWLPLHHACANGTTLEVMKLLVEAYPPGTTQQDHQNRTALHFYVTRNTDHPALMATNAALLAQTGAAALRDGGGMLPTHYACAYGTHSTVLKVLARACPASLTALESHGRTPMHLAMVNAHREASPQVIRFLLQHSVDSRQTINARDQDGYLPLHLLALALRGYKANDHDKRANVSECLKMYLNAEPIAAADFLTAIQDLPGWLKDTAVVSKHVRTVLNEKIVQRFPTSILMLDGMILAIIIVCFTITTHNHIDIRFSPTTSTNHTQGALVVLFIGAAYFLIRELVQVISLWSLGCLTNYWSDLTNWLNIAVIVLVFYYAVLMTNDTFGLSNGTFRSGVTVTEGVLYTAIIVYLKNTLVDFAVFVGGVFYVVRRLVAFMISVGTILLAFAQMFYYTYVGTYMCSTNYDPNTPNGGHCRFAHCTFYESLLKVYTMMLGQINDVTKYGTSLQAEILFLFYAFIVVILFSNVLIAVVTDSWEVIQNDRAAIVFWSNRLDFVAEMDAISYAVRRRLLCRLWSPLGPGGERKFDSITTPTSSAANPASAVAASFSSAGHNTTDMNNLTLDASHPEGPTSSADAGLPPSMMPTNEPKAQVLREAWHQIMLLFDSNLYDDIDWIETMAYAFFRFFSFFVIIPLWLTLGFISAGWLWPPQVREYLFVQKDTAISRSELEHQKLEQLKAIQMDLRSLQHDILREMGNDREEIVRMKAEVETVQTEVLADLLQVKELMSSLIVN